MTTFGQIKLKASVLRPQGFEAAITEHEWIQKISFQKARIEVYAAGASVHRFDSIVERLYRTITSPWNLYKLNNGVCQHIESWRKRPIEGENSFGHVDEIALNRCRAGEV